LQRYRAIASRGFTHNDNQTYHFPINILTFSLF